MQKRAIINPQWLFSTKRNEMAREQMLGISALLVQQLLKNGVKAETIFRLCNEKSSATWAPFDRANQLSKRLEEEAPGNENHIITVQPNYDFSNNETSGLEVWHNGTGGSYEFARKVHLEICNAAYNCGAKGLKGNRGDDEKIRRGTTLLDITGKLKEAVQHFALAESIRKRLAEDMAVAIMDFQSLAARGLENPDILSIVARAYASLPITDRQKREIGGEINNVIFPAESSAMLFAKGPIRQNVVVLAGYATNAADWKLFSEYPQVYAEGIANAVLRY
jgi:hypothetical protein